MKYQRILSALCATPWAIVPEKLDEIFGVVEARAAGVRLSAAEVKAIAGARRKKYAAFDGSVAVLPLLGTISQRFGLLEASGGTSADEFGQAFDRAMADPAVGAILMDVDSPGGSVYGVAELAEKIATARGKGKPIVAVANSRAGSAAYWLATSADELVVTTGGDVGSVGVIMAHVDESKADEMQGIKVTYITAGKYKAEQHEPLDDDARAFMQATADRYYEAFVDGVAKNRGVTPKVVKSDFGQGRMYGAKEAVERKMADRVATFEQVLAELAAASRPPGRASAGSRAPRSSATLRKELNLRKRQGQGRGPAPRTA